MREMDCDELREQIKHFHADLKLSIELADALLHEKDISHASYNLYSGIKEAEEKLLDMLEYRIPFLKEVIE